jgi:KDO2-lipid IV(A) lauroyltransferase
MGRTVKNALIYWTIRPWILFFSIMPVGLTRSFFALLGSLAVRLDGSGRRRALDNLVRAFPEWTREKAAATVVAVYRHLGICLAELIRFDRMTDDELDRMVITEGYDRFARAYERGNGVLAVTGHIGNWEILAAYTARRFPVYVIGRDVYDPRFNQLLTRLRERRHYHVLSRQGSAKPILRVLRQGGMIGILCDQETGVASIFADFFGRPALTPMGPALLARQTGAAMVPVAIARQEDGRYKITVGEEIPAPEKEGGEAAVLRAVQAYTSFLEQRIREHPEQWVWLHDRWKTQPD